MAVANSRICTVSSGYPEIEEFATAVTESISDFQSQLCKSKLFRMRFSVRYRSLTVQTSVSMFVDNRCPQELSIDVGRQPIDNSCTQRYCTRGWHDAVCIRLDDTNG